MKLKNTGKFNILEFHTGRFNDDGTEVFITLYGLGRWLVELNRNGKRFSIKRLKA